MKDSNQHDPNGKPVSNKSITAPNISLPKGGGALKGITEKFASNPVTGTATLQIPIPISTTRSGFSPQPVLAYDSGNGNSAFGLGWNVAVPTITRKTDKGLPRYQDEKDSDTFVLLESEDLVPALKRNGSGGWDKDTFSITISGV